MTLRRPLLERRVGLTVTPRDGVPDVAAGKSKSFPNRTCLGCVRWCTGALLQVGERLGVVVGGVVETAPFDQGDENSNSEPRIVFPSPP